jgi:hypothetical protein
MSYSKSVTVLLASVVCLGLAADAGAQSRGRSGGGGRSGGRGPSVGRAVPRGGGGGGPRNDGRSYGRSYDRGRSYGSRVIVSPRVFVGAPLRSYYYPYYGYRSGLSIGRFGSYGYPYGYGYPYYGYRYGYPYGAYGYSYGGYYPAGYGYGGGGYGYRDAGYGGVRIQGAVRNAEVLVDGYYAGIVDDFDGPFQRLELEGGAHSIEIRAPGFPPLTYDVNVQPGQTVTLHANVR